MQWRDGSFPQSHCVPGTAVRAREEGPSASPPAGWRSNLQPETNAQRTASEDRKSHTFTQCSCRHSIHSVTSHYAESTNQSGIFVSVQSGSGDSRQSQPRAWCQGHTVTPGGSLEGRQHKAMWVTAAGDKAQNLVPALETIPLGICARVFLILATFYTTQI